jgi:hypothetical protein
MYIFLQNYCKADRPWKGIELAISLFSGGVDQSAARAVANSFPKGRCERRLQTDGQGPIFKAQTFRGTCGGPYMKKKKMYKQKRFLKRKTSASQGCQMAYFQTKNPDLGKFWRVWQWTMLVNCTTNLVYFVAILYILWLFVTFYGNFEYFMVIWYFFPVLVCCTKKNLATLHTCMHMHFL